MEALIAQQDVCDLMTEAGALINGHFVLTSGRHAPIYINKDAIFRCPGLTSFLCSIFAFHFRHKHVEVVAGPTVGGVALTQWTAHYLQLLTKKHVQSIFIDEGPEKSRIIKRGYDKVVKGRRVLMVEDITTTAGSVMKSIEAVRKSGALNVVGVGVLFNRNPENNTAETLGVPELFCLVKEKCPDWLEEECPLCKDGTPINTEVGKGREFLAKKEGGNT